MNDHVEPTMAKILKGAMRPEPGPDTSLPVRVRAQTGDIEADARCDERRASWAEETESRIERSLWGNQD